MTHHDDRHHKKILQSYLYIRGIFTTVIMDDTLYMLKTGKKINLDVISGFKYLTPKEHLLLEPCF